MSKTCIIECSENLSTKNITVKETKKSNGTTVSFLPDYERFGVKTLPKGNLDSLLFELLHLSITYPNISFTLNKEKLKIKNFKEYCNYYGDVFVNSETKGLKFIVLPNSTDNFKFVHFVNSLNVFNGGEINNWIVEKIVNGIFEKLSSKYKSLKKGDIKNKLFIVSIFDDIFNPRFGDQIKSICTNKYKDFQTQISEPDWDKIIQKILKTPEIIDPIIEFYKLKEELQKRKDMKGLEKPKKKIKSEKYLPSIGTKKYLILAEGDSATGGLVPVLGRKEFGYYSLKGKPLNAYSADQSKFTQNKELSELYLIIKNEGYEKIIIANDADADGSHIRILLAGFFQRYLPECKTQVGALLTPIMATKKNGKMQNWIYNFGDKLEVKSGETQKYYKGLGSFLAEDLLQVVQKDGLGKMIEMIDFDSDEILDDWLSGDKSDKRKEYILLNDFDITKI